MEKKPKDTIIKKLNIKENYKDYDVFVLGFTFSERFGIKYQNNNLDFYPGFHGLAFDNQELELAHSEIYKYFYKLQNKL